MWIQFKKEMLELFRDKKNLLLTILMPIIFMPLIMLGSIFFASTVTKTELEKIKYYMLIDEIPHQMQDQLAAIENLEKKEFEENYQQLIKEGELSFALGFNNKEYEVFYNGSDFINNNQGTISDLVTSLNKQHTEQELSSLGLNETQQLALLEQFKLKQTNLASKEQISTKVIGGLLPFLAILIMSVSAVATSSDICAGEKERQTMETLMLSPNSILNTLMGKWFAITVFSLISGLLMLISFSIGISSMKLFIDIPEISQVFSIMTISNLLITLIILIPASGIISALLLTSSSLASSFKEAQTYGSMALMIVLAPQAIITSGILEISNQSVFYPLINLNLWLLSFFNHSAQLMYLVPILLVNFAVIAALLVIAFSLYKSERIIFKQ